MCGSFDASRMVIFTSKTNSQYQNTSKTLKCFRSKAIGWRMSWNQEMLKVVSLVVRYRQKKYLYCIVTEMRSEMRLLWHSQEQKIMGISQPNFPVDGWTNYSHTPANGLFLVKQLGVVYYELLSPPKRFSWNPIIAIELNIKKRKPLQWCFTSRWCPTS